ncbi:helix-turn-helix domain-containing protein [Streptomyces sp. NBC_01525]|uniref:helix-turn-helix domain-containing protein n=1 Tax=Streptomyces sp. NBC_01525 TaxID=2903893 RepID=UPI00386A55AE
MPPRNVPTARQARLGGELRKLRERAGKTAREAAGMMSTDQAKISHIEAGRVGVSEEKLPDDELKARVEHRMKRRDILERDASPKFEAIIHEAALHMRIGGRKVARRQLEHLLSVSEHPGLTLRVIPFTSDVFIDVTQTVLYASGVVSQLDTVHVDSPIGGKLLDAAAGLGRYRVLLDRAEQAALTPEESRSFIHHVTKEL